MADHLSRKELKQDKVRESFEHGAEAIYSHGRLTGAILLVALVVGGAFVGWKVYSDRKTVEASAAFDGAMKVFAARIRNAGEPAEPGEVTFTDEASRSQEAATKFIAVADKYPSTNPGKLARYYAALTLEDLERRNQALEQLKKLDPGRDKELAAMVQFQMAIIDSREGKTADGIKILRSLIEKPTVLVPKAMVTLELAGQLRQTNPQEATSLYQQLKKDYPDSPIAEAADRGLDAIPPKS